METPFIRKYLLGHT